MKSPTLLLLSLLGLLILAGAFGLFTSSERKQPKVPEAESNTPPTPVDYEIQSAQWDASVWAPELLGQEYGAVIERLWDALRSDNAPISTLLALPLDTLEFGTFSPTESIQHEIHRRELQANPEASPRTDWRTAFQEIHDLEFDLEQMEFRHIRFWLSQDQAPHSHISFTLHSRKQESETRHILRGIIEIRWRPKIEPSLSALHSAKIISAEHLFRIGPPPFGHVIPADLTPSRDSQVLEPNLQLHDLDHNGLSEIVIARINQVYWNQGQGKFNKTPLCDFPLPFLNNGLFEDFDGDGTTDFLAFNATGLALFVGTEDGRFPTPPIEAFTPPAELKNPFMLTAGDVDGDADLDVWLAQYRSPYQNGQMPSPPDDANDGYPSHLLINDGKGMFSDQTTQAGLASKRFRRTYSASFFDYDNDQDQDLIVISDFAGIDIYQNQGAGGFLEASPLIHSDRHAFGMAHCFADFNLDGHRDILMIGMNAPTATRLDHLQLEIPSTNTRRVMRAAMNFGNRLYLQNETGFHQSEPGQALAQTGWSWGVAPGDFDNDGDEDIYIVNGHITAQSVADYEKDFWLYDIHLGNSDENEPLAQFFESKQQKARSAGASFGGHELNRFFLNLGNSNYLEVGYLMGMSLSIDCRNLVADDLDGDGKLEWLLTSFETWPEAKQALHLFPNFTETKGNWIGARLRGARDVPVSGAVVRIQTSAGTQERYLVNGDSYRSQRANTVHFGIGAINTVETLSIRWPTGLESILPAPQINTYHEISAEQSPQSSN